MLGLVDTARTLRNDLQRKERENEAGRQALDSARREMAKLHEERDLLRATLIDATKQHNPTIKSNRPVSAPRARAAPPKLADGRRAAGGEECGGCEESQAATREAEHSVRVVTRRCEELVEKVRVMEVERTEWIVWKGKQPGGAPAAPSPPAVGPLPSRPAAGGDGALQEALKKLAEAEKVAAQQAAEIKKLQAAAVADMAKFDAASKDLATKAARITELEAALAEEKARASLLEKRLNDVSLNKKATDESSSGVLDRERELLKQVELLTREMTEATKQAGASAAAAENHKKTVEVLKGKMAEERDEADAIQKRLIAQVKDLREKLALAEKDLKAARAALDKAEKSEAALRARVEKLEAELRAAREAKESAGDADLLAARKKVAEVQVLLAAAEAALGKAKAEVVATKRDLVGLETDLQRARLRFDEREKECARILEARDEEARARKALEDRLATMEKQAAVDQAAMAALRERVRILEKQLSEEAERAKQGSSGDAEARVLRAELKKVKETLEVMEKGLAEAGTRAGVCDKKLRAAMRAHEASEARFRQVEKDREETRAVENAFKLKMKSLYDKRVKELEAVQKEFEERLQDEAKEALGKSGGAGARPTTAQRRR